jgi:putative ABC transport system substrate-binding protein
MNFYNAELGAKRLELLREMRRPRLVGVLFNPSNPEAEHELKDIEAAARALEQRIILLNASSSSDIDTAFATLVEMKGDALISTADTLFNNRRVQIVSLAARHAIPAIYVARDWAAAGGLMSYGAPTADAWRQVGIYAGRILKGEKAAELPVIQPTKFEFVINLQTAKLLGLNLSPMLLARADEVIE